jgi:hypothetical protein
MRFLLRLRGFCILMAFDSAAGRPIPDTVIQPAKDGIST